ncbi:hypothetical protein BGX34_005293 [Mortierella sp. NVP85]|nr:hypothetical protein BGX34_005293 [Mortierella sp. NVP85]
MSSLCNRIYDDNLTLLGPRKHSVRTRRLSVRKQTLYRREDLADTYMDRQHADLQSTLSPSASSRPRFMKESTAIVAPSTVSTFRRCDTPVDGDVAFSPFQVRSAGGLLSSYQYQGPAPLPPAILRVNMPGSPLSPYDLNNYAEYVFPRHRRSSSFGGARAMGAGGRCGGYGGRGGRGDSPVPSGVHPGQEGANSSDGDAEGDESEGRPAPSSYTFRRRNAIVEGSEDAPRAHDFSDS